MEEVKKNEMVITLASPQELVLIKGLLGDEAETEGCDINTIIRNFILKSLMPESKSAAGVVYELYTGNGYINRIVKKCYDLIITGRNKHCKNENWLTLVELAAKYEKDNPVVISTDDGKLSRFYGMYDRVVERLYIQAKNSTSNKKYWKVQIEYAKQLKASACFLPVNDLYNFIIKNWSVFYEWDIMYKMLGELAGLANPWEADAFSRYTITCLLRHLTVGWP